MKVAEGAQDKQAERVCTHKFALAMQQLYRAMDFLIESGDALQEEMFSSVAHLLNLEVDLLFFDTTSTYFEVDEEDPEDKEDEESGHVLRRRGHPKDHRPDLVQIVIGLAVTREGIPIRCWVWPGNTADVTRVEQVKRDLLGWKLGRVVTVVDRGFASEDLRLLQRAGGHYIAGERMQSGKPVVEEPLSRRGWYQKVTHNVEVKEIIVGEEEARQRFILVRNPHEERRDRERREQILRALQEELDGLSRLAKKEHGKAVCRLVSHPVYGRYLKLDRRGWPKIDQAKVKAEERLDGKYPGTSDDTLSPADVALGYKQLLEVEGAFRTLKQSLDLCPVYHRLSRRIRSHVLLCWLALLLIRVAETQIEEKLGGGYTLSRLRDELERMHLGIFEGPAGTVWQRTETTPFQRQILRALNIEEPPRFFRMDPRRGL